MTGRKPCNVAFSGSKPAGTQSLMKRGFKMGTINYGTSDYITMGYEPCHSCDFSREEAREEMIFSCGYDADSITVDDVDEFISETIQQYEEDAYYTAKEELKKHSFYYFHITLNWGYYEGFHFDIEYNFPVAVDTWEDKPAAQKEITEIKAFLLTCAENGLVACFPSWGTEYHDYNQTIADIKKAVKEMRQTVKSTPTWLWYERNQYR